MPLSSFSQPTREWFADAFAAPTEVQARGWPPIVQGQHTLLCAPTGSGKTLAAFLACLDRLTGAPAAAPGVRVLYVSPLKALAYDLERNLRAPLAGIQRAAERLGRTVAPVRVAVRTGDTPARDRRQLLRDPAEILITTPESLYLLLGSQARETLRTVETVIVDEIHALAAVKRGAHLALSLERLVELCGRDVQRIGLSATQRPLDEMGRFLGGERPVTIVNASSPPALDLTLEVPAEADPGGGGGAWPGIHARVLDLVRGHESTIIFVNSRRLCERLAGRLNELAGGPLVRAHHGSIARAQRVEIEAELKAGKLKGLVATSSLELGIDMAAVDLVIQIGSPGTVARGLQRVGRAGHGVGRRSAGTVLPMHRGDLLEAAVVAQRMRAGELEPITVPRNPLDVLAQQLVAMTADRPWRIDDLARVVARAHPYRTLGRELLTGVLDMLAGRYPSDDFPDLRPRVVWDRVTDVVTARRDARLVATVNGGTIPDRGLYAVHLGAGGPRIGELDEEMVHELRAGQTFLLGATTWRITEITRDRVLVKPAPGEPGKMPFWRGEGPGRPVELGRALGAFTRELGGKSERAALAWLRREHGLDGRAARDLVEHVTAQKEATGELPTDQTVVVERFRDELGDWRVCLLTPWGARVHAPWAMALEARLRGTGEVQALWSDDGVVLRLPDADSVPALADLLPEPGELEELLLRELAGSSLFATRFRENAARALLLPRRRPGARTPLWAQRLRAHELLGVASKHPGFPIILETYREMLQDVFDVSALRGLLEAIRRRDLRVVEVETASASPFARGLAYAYVAATIYEGDAPLAERRAQALALDRNLLRELLGAEELRELLDPEAMAEVEAELQALAEDRRARGVDGLADLLRRVGDLGAAEIDARTEGDGRAWLAELERSGRVLAVRLGRPAETRWIAVEDAARYRDALGVVLPPGVPAAFTGPAAQPLEGLVARYARTHGPFAAREVAARFGVAQAAVAPALRALVAAGRAVEGELRPGGSGVELCDADVLRLMRRLTLARLRHEVAPVEAAALARFLPRWHGVGAGRGGPARLREAVEQLEGLPLPFSELERAILPARVADYHPRMLDELGAAGELVWVGRGALGSDDGRVMLVRRERAAALLPDPEDRELGVVQLAILDELERGGATFFGPLVAAAGATPWETREALWDLVWSGHVTNDTFGPLRLLARRRTRELPPGGRWSAVAQLRRALSPEARTHAVAVSLLERYGVVSREAALGEGTAGGFAAVAHVYRTMEEAGKVRRGHFALGFTGAQFAHPAAVDRLRAARDDSDETDVHVLSAVDPALAWGALLSWPGDPGGANGRPRRAAGARVVLVRGQPVLYLERDGRRLRILPAAADDELLDAALPALRAVAGGRRHRELRIIEINGVPALRSEHCGSLERSGFRVAPDVLVLEPREEMDARG